MTSPDKELHEDSPAFRLARLKSERLRIQIVLATIGAAFAVLSLRTVILFSRENLDLWLITTLFFAVFVVYELFVLRAVNRSEPQHRRL